MSSVQPCCVHHGRAFGVQLATADVDILECCDLSIEPAHNSGIYCRSVILGGGSSPNGFLVRTEVRMTSAALGRKTLTL